MQARCLRYGESRSGDRRSRGRRDVELETGEERRARHAVPLREKGNGKKMRAAGKILCRAYGAWDLFVDTVSQS